jgi:hypothetical protein
MLQPDGRRELSGLARSIDALFARRPPEPEPSGAAGKPATDVAETVEARAWASGKGSPLAVGDGPAATGSAQAEPPRWDEPVPGADTASSAGDLARAVERALAGESRALDEVRALARALQERLALDPLADAAERLVLGVGDPPDARLLDLAGEVVDPAVASRLVQRIGREREPVRLRQYELVCRRLGRVMAIALRGALTDVTDEDARRTYCNLLISMGEVSRPIIEGMVQDENRFLVRSGVAILGELGGRRAIELVTATLADTDARVRREALLALAKIGDRSVAPLVLGMLDDPDAGVRIAAAVAAGRLKVDRALRRLLAMLEDESDPEALALLLDALGELEDPGAVQAIEKLATKTLFSKPPVQVRIAAYRALHRIGTPRARQVIQAALDDKDPAVQAAVRRLVRENAVPAR